MPTKKADSKDTAPADDSAGTPIVVRRQIMTKDTVPPAEPVSPEVEADDKTTLKKVRIEPLDAGLSAKASESTQADPIEKTTNTAPATKPVSPVQPAAAKPEPEPEPIKTAEPIPAENEGFALDGAEDETDPSKHPLDEAAAKAEKEAKEKQAALDKMVAAQAYFLPINQVEKRRTKLIALIILLLFLVAAGAAAYAYLKFQSDAFSGIHIELPS